MLRQEPSRLNTFCFSHCPCPQEVLLLHETRTEITFIVTTTVLWNCRVHPYSKGWVWFKYLLDGVGIWRLEKRRSDEKKWLMLTHEIRWSQTQKLQKRWEGNSELKENVKETGRVCSANSKLGRKVKILSDTMSFSDKDRCGTTIKCRKRSLRNWLQ